MKNIIYIIVISFFISSCSQEPAGFESIGGGEVLSGSYANMLTLGDFLYVLGDGQLKTLSLTNPAAPTLIDEQVVDFSIESLFINNSDIFIGSPEGMFIYTIGSDGIPVFRSQTQYENIDVFCFSDPIAANDDIAYVTLDGNMDFDDCFRPDLPDQMRIFDLSDIENPMRLHTIDMLNPKGIALDGNHLFVCEEFNGITAFELDNPIYPEVVFKSEDFGAYDLIPANGLLLVVGPDTLHQFNYTDINNINKIGEFSLRD